MERLFEVFDQKLKNVPSRFSRFLKSEINWDHRLISITGARGAGKTILILQHIIEKHGGNPSKEVLYADVSHLYFSANSIYELADEFYKKGGKYLFLDEIHMYPEWATEIKQIYDTFNDLHVVFTGSSILDIERGGADLSRRLVKYFLTGLSFREFISLDQDIKFEPITLTEIRKSHRDISRDIISGIKPLSVFDNYLRYGYYPFFIEGKDVYPEKLNSTINQILEVDLPASVNIDYGSIRKLKKLFTIISTSVPFKPNINKISELTDVSRPTLSKLMDLLERAQLIISVQSATKGIQQLGKIDKIYLNNTNIMNLLATENANKGNLRETFFLNQLINKHRMEIPKSGDFMVDGKYTFEIGGKNKNSKQIKDTTDSYIVSDDIETGFETKIPLWLFGFLY